MTLVELILFFLWVAAAFWGGWYFYVQTTRLHSASFLMAKNYVLEKIGAASGVYWFLGVVIYSPYVWPWRALFFWVLCCAFFLKGF